MKKSLHDLMLCFITAAFLMGGSVDVQAQGDSVIALAKKEGRVSYYGTQDMAAATAMIRSFQETWVRKGVRKGERGKKRGKKRGREPFYCVFVDSNCFLGLPRG